MRGLTLLALVFVAAPVYSQENEAEKLFNEMEKKIRSAKSVHFEFDSETRQNDAKFRGRGSFDLAEGRTKFRIKSEVKRGDMEVQVLIAVSDGNTTYAKSSLSAEPFRLPGARPFNDNHLGLLARLGVTTFFNACEAGPIPFVPRLANFEDDISKSIVAKNFKLGAKEKVGGQDTQVVHYDARLMNEKDPLQVTLWIDTKTHLPAKQAFLVSFTAGGKAAKQEETLTFQTFVVDGPIDRKILEIPK
jgi:outer membrane lipoprotein-sorting protein